MLDSGSLGCIDHVLSVLSLLWTNFGMPDCWSKFNVAPPGKPKIVIQLVTPKTPYAPIKAFRILSKLFKSTLTISMPWLVKSKVSIWY